MTLFFAFAAGLSIAVFVAALLYAAITDVRAMRISNKTCLVVVCTYCLYAVASSAAGKGPDIMASGAIAACVFAITATLFAFGFFGGGDVKLLSAVALWTTPTSILDVLVVITAVGGLIAVVILAQQSLIGKLRLNSEGAAAIDQRPIPYGPAITLGGLYQVSELILNGFY
ncbi:MAG: prepilin peptidase [Sphingomonadales bacterium]